MASSKDRERKLARAKLDRQMARRAAKARSQRQIQARIGAGVAVLLIAGGVYWFFGGGGGGKKPETVAPPCSWIPVAAATAAPSGSPAPSASASTIKDVGLPPTTDIPVTGYDTMTITTSQGVITGQIDITGATCAAASFSYLAGTGFFDNTICNRLTTGTQNALYCGGPSITGDGGPAYEFADEDLPLGFQAAPGSSAAPSGSADPPSEVIYPAGTIAMDNTGTDTNGSRFFIVYKDSVLPPDYSLVGNVTGGLDVVTKIAKGGVTPGVSATDGKPKTGVTITSMTVTPQATGTPSPAPEPSGSGSPAPSASSSQS